jgi:subtilisin family serine protease
LAVAGARHRGVCLDDELCRSAARIAWRSRPASLSGIVEAELCREFPNSRQRTGAGNRSVQAEPDAEAHPESDDPGWATPAKTAAVRGGVYNFPLSALSRLANDPDVAYISPNRPVAGANDFTEATVGADVAQSYGWNGAGIGVAVIDSGISDHPDLHDPATGLSRVVYNQSFVPGTDASDGYGHGTHVAGIIAGNGSQSNGMFFGVAP